MLSFQKPSAFSMEKNVLKEGGGGSRKTEKSKKHSYIQKHKTYEHIMCAHIHIIIIEIEYNSRGK